ncbi:CHAD domain-containing protein [Kitasatospora gansuensis]|uniref:CHAD domain-containing protein n=1 Tax=Kitasatospora gansuensis TaxID=258050 RepID=A0A7W7WFW9_9ACTN|nr:CHAD domain-containing protein [Kitasatospora gansuensis]MBB4945015.1 CHAD domain-containing protein [Kitasatospora gansuensis]
MPKRRPSTGDLLAARIAGQTAALAGLEPLVRADAPDAVHRMRVACRRLRSALREYGGPDQPVAGELRRLGLALGAARDAEVLGAALVAEARTLPAECGPELIAAELDEWARRRAAAARPEVLAALDSPRYRALLGELGELSVRPPDGTGLPPYRKLARRAEHRVARRLGAARGLGGEERDAALHRARKAAKRARYLGETAGAAGLAGAVGLVERMKAVQDVLGAHQDAVVARQALRELARTGHPFEYGVLYARQLAAGCTPERLEELLRAG